MVADVREANFELVNKHLPNGIQGSRLGASAACKDSYTTDGTIGRPY